MFSKTYVSLTVAWHACLIRAGRATANALRKWRVPLSSQRLQQQQEFHRLLHQHLQQPVQLVLSQRWDGLRCVGRTRVSFLRLVLCGTPLRGYIVWLTCVFILYQSSLAATRAARQSHVLDEANVPILLWTEWTEKRRKKQMKSDLNIYFRIFHGTMKEARYTGNRLY